MRTHCILTLLLVLGFSLAPIPAAAGEPCEECHELDRIGDGNRSLHPPFEDGECLECHLDHGDEEKLMLAEKGNALCDQCHQRDDEDFLSAHKNISGDRASCLSCHDPHRSSLTTLLRPRRHRPLAYGRCDPCHRFDGRLHKTEVKELCFDCHEREEFTRDYGHLPVVDGECLGCHDPHGSQQRALLLDHYTEERWIRAGEDDYPLCLGCHEADAFTAPGDEETTSFRSGSMNIHQVHVEGQGRTGKVAPDRGLTCRNCHEVHSANYPKLIRASLDCGGVPCLKLNFQNLPEGGMCSVSCHGTKSYNRSGAGPEPAASSSPPPPPAPAEEIPFSEPTELGKSINKRCRSCHREDVQAFSRPYVHLPVRQGNCSACHLDHGPDNKLILLDRQDRLCSRCHDLRSKAARSAHGQYSLSRARCSECHNPHAAGNPLLLHPVEHDPFSERDCGVCHGDPSEGWSLGVGINRVCGECHDGITDFPVPHSALKGKGCVGCHRPHAAESKQFLRAEVPELCLRCHTDRRFSRETVHAPVDDGDCGACHAPHGSEYAGLLALPYPLQQYLDYKDESYALCWECHQEEFLTDPSSSADTGFRDRDGNLHARHIRNRTISTEQGERTARGVTCRNCHDPHSTDGPLLIRDELDCGGVPCLQLEFHKVGEGGRCLGGCHLTESYLPPE